MRYAFFVLLSAFSLSAMAFNCPPPGPGLQDITAFGYYTDAAHSIRDEAKARLTHALTKPFEDFSSQVGRFSDRYLEEGNRDAASCAVSWLERWAQDRAMLGQMIRINNDQAEYTRKWINASLAISWNAVRARATTAQRERIDGWLAEVSRATLAYWHNKPRATRNNHYYWTGVGVLATAVATGDDALFAEARAIYDTALGDIQDDGSLPHEMRRGIRALHYHNFSIAALAIMAEMARARGEDWFALRNARLGRLALRVIDGLRDPAWFAKESSAAPQVLPSKADCYWIRIVNRRMPALADLQELINSTDSTLGRRADLILGKGIFDSPP